jgi:DNA-binding NtrC family response regulator
VTGPVRAALDVTMLKNSALARSRVQPLHLVPATQPVCLEPRQPAVAPVAVDPAMRQLVAQVERVAGCDLPVLVQGESGAGKEVIVQHLHALSQRAHGPFVAENCSAIPEALAESLLFGHVRGSFTGADRDREGLFAQACGGTLFLDEIGDMPLALQARLLRVLEEKRVRPVGGQQSIPVDVRVVCATNTDLAELVRTGRFRSDLYYRLAGVTLRVPALRERPADVDVLANRFLAQLDAEHGTQRRLSDDLLDRMRAHSWPGNVRELRNCVAALYHLCDGDVIDDPIPQPRSAPAAPAQDGQALVTRVAPLRDIEKEAIQLALAATRGDRRKAARLLGISRSTIYVRIRELGL